MERLAYIPCLVAYAWITVVHLLPGLIPERISGQWRAVSLGGVLAHTVALVLSAAWADGQPGFPEALSAAALGTMVAFLWTGVGRLRALGMLLAPMALVMVSVALVVPNHKVSALVEHASSSPLLPLHLGLMFSGLAGFAVSFAVGVAYLVVRRQLKQKDFKRLGRMPSLERLDRVQFRAMLFGFVFLTLGIGVGGVWAAAALEQPWAFDGKVAFTLLIWFWYGLALQLRLVAGWRGRWSALFSIVGFGGMIFSLVAMNFLVTGWHGYGG